MASICYAIVSLYIIIHSNQQVVLEEVVLEVLVFWGEARSRLVRKGQLGNSLRFEVYIQLLGGTSLYLEDKDQGACQYFVE